MSSLLLVFQLLRDVFCGRGSDSQSDFSCRVLERLVKFVWLSVEGPFMKTCVESCTPISLQDRDLFVEHIAEGQEFESSLQQLGK